MDSLFTFSDRNLVIEPRNQLPTKTRFGSYLRGLRTDVGLSQESFSSVIGISSSVLQRLERASLAELKKLLTERNLTAIFLYSGLTANQFEEATGIRIPTTTLLRIYHEHPYAKPYSDNRWIRMWQRFGDWIRNGIYPY